MITPLKQILRMLGKVPSALICRLGDLRSRLSCSADFQSAVSPTSSRQGVASSSTSVALNASQVGNLRYSRLETCATSAVFCPRAPRSLGETLCLALVLSVSNVLAQESNSAPATEKLDLLILGNGERLKGTVLNERFSFRTAYSHLDLEKAWLASLDLATDGRNLSTAITANSNRYTGFLENNSVTFRGERGEPAEIRRERITRIILGGQNHPGQTTFKGSWVRLKNGDILSGQVSPNPLPLVITNAQVSVRLDDVPKVTLTSDRRSSPREYTREDTGLVGALATDFLVIELDAGPKIELFRDTVESISQSFAVMSAVDHSEPTDSGAPGVAEGPPPTSSTNLEDLVWIPAGEFLMGSPYNELGRDPDEGPQVKVKITTGFWMGKYEVRQSEYEQVMGTNPSPSNEDTNLPVVKVNWHEAMDYCAKLTQMRETAGRLPTGYAFRLPTEAEWEYACRAGTTTRFSCGEDKAGSVLGDYAWFTRNSEFTAHPVGLKKANPWGLYDLHGNVMEWCFDRYERAVGAGKITNSATSATGSLRVARGGSWLYEAKACRSANRDDYAPSNRCSDIGFRVVLAPVLP